MDRNVRADHYDRLAVTLEEDWAHSPAFADWMTDCIQRRLRVTEGDLVADVGCGTGLYARRLAKHAAAVVCAEPSARMLAQVPADGKLIPVAASAEDLAAGRVRLPHGGYDAILVKEVLHHIKDRAAVISGLARLLRPGGRLLVVMLPTQISYPLFAAALERFTAGQPDPAVIAGNVRTAGLYSALTYQSFPLKFRTGRYLQMVRDRYMSLLSAFDDAQLEAGVAEIRQAHPGETVAFTDTYAFVLGTAP